MEGTIESFNFDPSIFDRTNINTIAQRIVGGYEVRPQDKYPFIAGLGTKSEINCGGTFLSNKWVLTAAHCADKPIDSYKVYRNLHSVFEIGKNWQITEYNVKNIIVHPDWSVKHRQNDVALFELDSDPPEIIEPSIYLDNSDATYEYDDEETLYTIMGYGQVKHKGPYSSVLLETGVPIYNFTKCKGTYRANRVNIGTTQFCAGYTDGNSDSCIGDSGGPMAIRDGVRYNSYGYHTTYKLVGIVNFGIRCGEGKYPGIYLKVNKFIEWIKSVTGRNWAKYTN